ncbi:oligosaccharide flippase family protein [Mucilaginibacter sp. BT774]|uniref:oligosaccharide flippase family protein n=1 Tax=Mucilaginibacter sp. BT774 TaxID=3062276 RepID=UPI002676AE56|nr:oligosaccharide flippase family protein [Mucilaginibacter sp. BT774]MDO3624767.1 oligosaccharide flippase family protein [Mucilaginibacter sp. BT774]
MRRALIKNLSANTLQLIINQLAGLIIFYIISKGLDKDSFGEINLALALMLAGFNILSFGIDQIAVRKLASGENPQNILPVYLCHVLITGFAFYLLLFLGRFMFTSLSAYDVILFIGAGKLMIYFSTPFKQSAIGLERFKLLAGISIVSNLVRAIGLITLACLHQITLINVIIIFIGGDILELTVGTCLFALNTTFPISIQWNKNRYTALIKESLPQFGVTIITSALARFDWIFIGLALSAAKLAEYSFAYKVFELSTMPLLAIAPLLIPWFTRLFKDGNQPDTERLKFLVRIEMVIAAFTIVLINVCWAPVIDHITDGKYGGVNVLTIFMLTLCIPLQYLTNFLWTINFAKGRLKMIFHAFVITLIVNVIGDLILIPIFKNEGAAFAYLAGYIAQTAFYIYKNDLKELSRALYTCIICTACACVSFWGAKYLFTTNWIAVAGSVLIYAVLLLATRQVRLTDKDKILGMT